MAAADYSTIITALSVAGGLALSVERIIEFLKHIMELDTQSNQDRDKWDTFKRAKKLFDDCKTISNDIKNNNNFSDNKVDQSRLCQYKSIDELIAKDVVTGSTEGSFADSEADEKYPAPEIGVIAYKPRPPVEAGRIVFFQLMAVGLGILFASLFDLKLMYHFLTMGFSGSQMSIHPLLDLIVTGIIVGGGSQPIHVLIRFITKRKIPASEFEESNERISQSTDPDSRVKNKPFLKNLAEKQQEPLWLPIGYQGGYRPASLAKSHIRTDNPNLIVYHHTAMSDKKTFEDIVKEFIEIKGWLTGYNCVIMPDGTIKPFCRWDRYGNHAKGKNMRSLGIAFHGNFETNAGDKFSNSDGRYGNKRPTPEQLKAGARVVALWTHIYDDIELDFNKAILPHREAMDNKSHTVCPGSNFPVKEFEDLVTFFYESWDGSKDITADIEYFKSKDYLYV